ncbi:unnamed protein product [Alternaria alternata]
MPPNRIAIYGHRGLFSSQIVSALIASDASITILYRPGQESLTTVSSLVGDEGVSREFGFVQAIPRTNVKLFVPSDLGLRYGEDGMAIPLLQKKKQVQEAAQQAGIPLTVVLIANFAEFTLGSM